MGTTHSSPISFNNRHHNYIGNRDPLAYSTNFGTVRFRPIYKQTASRCYSKTDRSSTTENNNNAVKLTDTNRPSSYTTTTNKKSRSILASSWNFVAKRTASAMPSFLNSNANRSSNSLSSRDSSSIKHQSANFDTNARRISSGRQMSTSSSHDSNISCVQPHNQYHIQKIGEKNRRNLDELNCNVLSVCPEWELADRQVVAGNYNKPMVYSRKKSSQDSLNVFSCRTSQKYYDEQDLTNNNTTNWAIPSPQQMPNFITSLDQFATRGRTSHHQRNAKLEKNHSSLSTNSSEFSSNTASTESTSSFSTYNVANLSIQAKQQLYLNHEYENSDEEDEPGIEEAGIEDKSKSMLRTSYSQQSFLSPSDSFDNGVNGNVFGRNVIINSSTSDLLRGLGRYVSQHSRVHNFEPASLVMWLRSIDRSLMIQGWQDVAFITAANLVFVYLLIREQLAREYDKIRTINDLQSLVCCCLYVSYSYLGNEISYPLKPFISQHENRGKFWSRCVQLINYHSDDMLRVNHSTDFFMELFYELRSYADLER